MRSLRTRVLLGIADHIGAKRRASGAWNCVASIRAGLPSAFT